MQSLEQRIEQLEKRVTEIEKRNFVTDKTISCGISVSSLDLDNIVDLIVRKLQSEIESQRLAVR